MENAGMITEGRALALLARRHVSENAYLAWAAHRIATRTRRVGFVLSAAIAAVVISASIKAAFTSLDVSVDEALLLSGVVVAVLVFTVGAAFWMHANAVNPLAEGMLHLELSRWCTPRFIAKLSDKDWVQIRRGTLSAFARRTAPGITAAAHRRLERLAPWRRLAGWFSVTLFAVSLFHTRQEPSNDLVLGVLAISAGIFFCLHGAGMWIARRFEDMETGEITFGKPAVLVGAFAIAFGAVLVIFGIIGLIMVAA